MINTSVYVYLYIGRALLCIEIVNYCFMFIATECWFMFLLSVGISLYTLYMFILICIYETNVIFRFLALRYDFYTRAWKSTNQIPCFGFSSTNFLLLVLSQVLWPKAFVWLCCVVGILFEYHMWYVSLFYNVIVLFVLFLCSADSCFSSRHLLHNNCV